MSVAISAGCATRAGQIRAINEDAVLVTPRVFAVADGMGGHAAGDRASQLTVEALSGIGYRENLSREDVLDAISRANQTIVSEGRQHPEQGGMGTTVTGLAQIDMGGQKHWLVFNVGDSRTYCFDAGRLQQISVDHSEVQELIDAGQLTEAEARRHPARNVVTRSLGSEPGPVADHWLLPLKEEQTFLLCSDGLTRELDDTAIGKLLAQDDPPEQLAQLLAAAADDAGGSDNISAVIVRTARVAAAAEQVESDEDTIPRPVREELG